MLTAGFAARLHKAMFGVVWKWAGTYRTTGRNIGIDAYRIPAEVPALLGDVRYWVENKTWPPDEIAVRLHHRLVVLHRFRTATGVTRG